MNHWNIVRQFEDLLAAYTGAPHVIAVDSCSSALFLCCKFQEVRQVTIPKRTYISVPFSILNAGGTVQFEDQDWFDRGVYSLKPYPIIDAALTLKQRMYQRGQMICLSFNSKKPLPIGRGGCILLDDPDADAWLKKARCNGRSDVPMDQDRIESIGWNVYMTPEQAARGIELLHNHEIRPVRIDYPDLSTMPVFQKGTGERGKGKATMA